MQLLFCGAIGLLLSQAAAFSELTQPYDLVVVGAGAGGAYAAWRAALAGKSVCVLELAERPGGRIHSLRGQGPRGDLVVEAGAYRFAPHEVIDHMGNVTWRISTPLTAAIVKELGLPSKAYNPNASQWDHQMHKIVDAHGEDAGYLTLVETMLSGAAVKGASIRYNTRAVALASQGSELAVQLENGDYVPAGSVLLNLPQWPMLELLRRSTHPFASMYPRPLYVPVSYPIMKLYIHYDDAWWRNDLGLVAGRFMNHDDGPEDPMLEMEGVPAQRPAPLQGQYHDGHVRCDGEGGRCRGFLQAFYGGDNSFSGGGISGAIKWYSVFTDSQADDAATQISFEHPHQRELLLEVHAALVEMHRPALVAANVFDRVNQTLPTGGVISIWSQGVRGIHAGCHSPKPGRRPTPESLPEAAVQPFSGWPVFAANEAYGHMHCFAEGSLEMAEAAMKHLNVSRPAWLNEAKARASYSSATGLAQPPTDPFLVSAPQSQRHSGRAADVSASPPGLVI